MEQERMVEGSELTGDQWQFSLRPKRLNEYIGQRVLKENLEIFRIVSGLFRNCGETLWYNARIQAAARAQSEQSLARR